jgi:hypothetical protein
VRWTVGLIVASVAFGACNVLSPGNATTAEVAVPYPDGCAAFQLSAKRCEAIVEWAIGETAIEHSTAVAQHVASVQLLGYGCQRVATDVWSCSSPTDFVVRVRLQFDGGEIAELVVSCGVGGEFSSLCTEQPQIRFSGETLDGYRDARCGDENGGGCATPLPALDRSAVANARPLRVATFDIPIDHAGHYDVEVGRARLPNGVLSHSAGGLGDPTTQAVRTTEAGVEFDIRSADSNAPFRNYYDQGWHPGTEEVVVSVRFDVVSFDPGAVLQIRDVVVD